MSKLGKLAVIGVGHWGKNLLRNFCALLGPERVVACDQDPKRIGDISSQYPDVQILTDAQAVFDDPTVGAVVIATPVVTHYELASQALRAQKHVFVEKPIAMRSSEAHELIALAEQTRRVLMVDHLLEYHPAVERLHQLIRNGELGEIFYLYSQRLNLGIIRTEENALWSLAPHDISVMLYLLEEEPQRVWAHGASYLQEQIEDMALIILEFASGVRAHVHVSWLDPHKTRKLVVVGRKRMAIFDDTSSEKLFLFDKYVVRADGRLLPHDEGAHSISVPNDEPLRKVCEHFLQCIERGERPRSDGRDGLRVLRVLEAAQRSLDSHGAPITLAEASRL
jgi:UDP-2-acetamido-3-amino-2,3-dideoxy-glucuronate N-acetyltransferase